MNLSEQRKGRTEEFLQSIGLEFNPYLPCTGSEEETRLRTPKAIAERIVALAYTNVLAFDSVSPQWVQEQIKTHKIEYLFTPKELKFIADRTPEQKTHETWKVEAIWTLLWTVNLVEELDFPDELANLNTLPPGVYPISAKECQPNPFIERIERNHSIRSITEILDANDLYYRFYWACQHRRIYGIEMDIVNPYIVYERLYALNWLTYYQNQEWDNVSTDT